MKEKEEIIESPMEKWCRDNERSLVWLSKKVECSPAGLHLWCKGKVPKSIEILQKIQEVTDGYVTLDSLIEYKKYIESNAEKETKDK